jgi:adenylyltransferase/sulfurtransferase
VESPLSVRHGRFSADAEYLFAPGSNQTADVQFALTGRLAGRRATGSLSINTEISVEPYPVELDEQNAEAIVAGADVVLDCTDSFETRYLVNDACCAQGVALVEAGVLGFAGMVMAIRPGQTACYRCAFPEAPPAGTVPSCREAGILGAVAGLLGSLQALEALKLLTGIGTPPGDVIVQFDGLTLAQTLVRTSRREGCSACARVPASSHSPV